MPRPRQHPPELLQRGARLVHASNRQIARVARDLDVRLHTPAATSDPTSAPHKPPVQEPPTAANAAGPHAAPVLAATG
jgi:hypothetical protein